MRRVSRPTSARSRPPATSASPLEKMRNLGPACAAWLEAAGIRSEAEIRRLGAVETFRRVAFSRSGDVSMNLLYALEGAIRGIRWDHLTPEERATLRASAEAPPD